MLLLLEKMIPQMHDTANVIKSLNKEESKTKIIVIVANERGALEASNYDHVHTKENIFDIKIHKVMSKMWKCFVKN